MRRRRIMEIHKPGRVTKIVNATDGQEQAHIQVNPTDPLYGELRIANILRDSLGKPTRLNEGDDVDLIIRTDEDGTEPKR
jgi:hypothetical protein